MKKQLTILTILSLLILPTFAQETFLLNLAQDPEHAIEIQIPDGWKKIEETVADKGSSVVFTDATDHRRCSIFASLKEGPKSNFVSTAHVLKQLFQGNKSKYLVPQASFFKEEGWDSKIVIKNNAISYIGLAKFPLQHLAFGVILENDLKYEVLSDDACMFIQAISIAAKTSQSESK